VGQATKKKYASRPRRSGVLDKRFQENLRAFRKARGLKQSGLAEAMGWPNQNYVSQLETGIRGFSPDTVEELAGYFKVDPGEFFLPEIRRRPLRILFEALPKKKLQNLRGTGECDKLVEKFKEIVSSEIE
jgi:transcriptional regulator with XRE-family HTH domain